MDIEKAMEIKKTSISKDIIEQAKAFETIKVAVDELLKYRQIGTVDECRAAMEKMKPKNPAEDNDKYYCCPDCGHHVFYNEFFNGGDILHCEICGQALKWGD